MYFPDGRNYTFNTFQSSPLLNKFSHPTIQINFLIFSNNIWKSSGFFNYWMVFFIQVSFSLKAIFLHNKRRLNLRRLVSSFKIPMTDTTFAQNSHYTIWPVFVPDITCSLIGLCTLILGHYSPVKTKQKPYNKKLINLKCSVFTGKSQTSALLYWPRYWPVNTAKSQFEIFS